MIYLPKLPTFIIIQVDYEYGNTLGCFYFEITQVIQERGRERNHHEGQDCKSFSSSIIQQVKSFSFFGKWTAHTSQRIPPWYLPSPHSVRIQVPTARCCCNGHTEVKSDKKCNLPMLHYSFQMSKSMFFEIFPNGADQKDLHFADTE